MKKVSFDYEARGLVRGLFRQWVSPNRRSSWRQPLIGVLISALLAGLALVGMLWEEHYLHHLYFPGTLMLLFVIAIAFVWGLGPALVSAVLNTVALDVLSLPVEGASGLRSWDSLLPFLICTVLIALLISQQEAARLRSWLAQQREQMRANNLEEADRLKDQFLAIASHELKAPITMIRAQAQLSLRRMGKRANSVPDEERLCASLESIEAQTDRLKALANDVLDLSNIRVGKVALHLSMCDLRGICAEVVEEQRLLTGRPMILEQPPVPILISADKNRLHQVVTNVLTNAVKYSPEDSSVCIYVTAKQQTGRIVVCNEGEGIPQEQLTQIFEPFYRVPDARISSSEGSGLGLAIAKSIVEQHQGKIWCESSSGEETRFFVDLPLIRGRVTYGEVLPHA